MCQEPQIRAAEVLGGPRCSLGDLADVAGFSVVWVPLGAGGEVRGARNGILSCWTSPGASRPSVTPAPHCVRTCWLLSCEEPLSGSPVALYICLFVMMWTPSSCSVC